MKRFILGGAVLPLLLLVGMGAVQQLSHFEDKRPLQKEKELQVKVHFSWGEFCLCPAEEGELYSLELDYDKRIASQNVAYHTVGERGILDVEVKGKRGFKLRRKQKNFLTLKLTPAVPITLDLSLGACESTVDLSGLRIADLQIDAGAGETEVYFGQPNPEAIRRIKIDAGVGELEVLNLGNSNCQVLVVNGGVGDFLLDFSGDWQRDARAEIDLGLGDLTIKLPRDLGIKLIFDKSFLCSLSIDSFMKCGNEYTSENYEEARHHLTLNVEAGIGEVNIRWIE